MHVEPLGVRGYRPMLNALRRLSFAGRAGRSAVAAHPRQVNAPEDDALALVSALFTHQAGEPDPIQAYEDRWDEIDDQSRAIFTLTMLLGTLMEHEATRRRQPLERVINQIRADIAGDRYAHELGIEPRD